MKIALKEEENSIYILDRSATENFAEFKPDINTTDGVSIIYITENVTGASDEFEMINLNEDENSRIDSHQTTVHEGDIETINLDENYSSKTSDGPEMQV